MTSGTGLKILYVDDEPDLVTVVVRSLKLDPDMHVRAVHRGIEAIALIEEGNWRPDVILLDVMMPDLDGPGTLERLRQLPGQPIPVIFFTARVQDGELMALAELGVIGVLTKPFDPLLLAKNIRQMVEKG